MLNGILDAKYADADAILLLENIKVADYHNENRHIGFDVSTAIAILRVNACIHTLYTRWCRILTKCTIFLLFFFYINFIAVGKLSCIMYCNTNSKSRQLQ